MAVAVKRTPEFDPGIPVPLFDVTVTGFCPYIVTRDGRFLVNTPVAVAESAEPITVILNWTAGLK